MFNSLNSIFILIFVPGVKSLIIILLVSYCKISFSLIKEVSFELKKSPMIKAPRFNSLKQKFVFKIC